jgi:hypothetical protein
MIEGYFDESGIHAGAVACVVAGYYATASVWPSFQAAWNGVLSREGVDEFHAQVYFSGGSPYRRWRDDRRKQFLADLVSTIVSAGIYPVGASLVLADWDRLSLNERRFLTGAAYSPKRKRFLTTGAPGKPYFVPFQDCVTRVATSCAEGEKAHFSFAQNSQFAGYAADLYKLIRAHPLPFEPHLGNVSFPTPRQSVQLQAADLLCYLIAQYMPSRLRDSAAQVPPALKVLMTRAKSYKDFPIYHKEQLERQTANSPVPFDWSLDRTYLCAEQSGHGHSRPLP